MQALRKVVSASPLCASTSPAAFASPVTPTDAHFVRNHFPIPEVDAASLRVDLGGEVARPRAFTLDEIRARPAKTITATLECAGNGRTRMRPLPPGVAWDDRAVSTATWTGTPLAPLLREAAPTGAAIEVLFGGLDRGVEGGRAMAFERSLPLGEAMRPDVLLCWAMNGEPLRLEHGAPLRLLVPGWYAVASVKWLHAITLLAAPFEGWFQRDRYIYRNPGEQDRPLGPMRVKSILAPLEVEGRDVRVVGYAWSGEAPVARVEVALDDGPWQPAALDPPLGPHAWRRFTATLRAAPGTRRVRARAADEAGNEQPLESPWNQYGYGENAVPEAVAHVA